MAAAKRTSLELINTQAQEAKARLEALSRCRCLDLRQCGRRIKALVRADNEAMLADPEGVSS
jgi:hypothetical protein